MTISEIENTLQILIKRHPDLNEVMLIKLLTAGGWENITIRDAVSLFKSRDGKNVLTKGVSDFVSLPELEEERSLPEVVDINNSLLDRNPGAKPEDYFQKKTEPEIEPNPEMKTTVKESLIPEKKETQIESLIVPKAVVENYSPSKKVEQELPHNLPILPFEDTKKAWTFSKYIDFFYGKFHSKTKEEKVNEVEDKNIKAETKQEIKDEIKEELTRELRLNEKKPVQPVVSKEEIKEELRKEFKLNEVKNAPPVISKEEIKEEIKRELKLDEVKPITPVISKEEIKEELRKEFKLDEVSAAASSAAAIEATKEEIKEELIKELKLDEIKSAPPVTLKEEPVKNIQITERRIVVDNLHISKIPLSKKDEKLILVTGTMLIFIIILLGYMYSNGRI